MIICFGASFWKVVQISSRRSTSRSPASRMCCISLSAAFCTFLRAAAVAPEASSSARSSSSFCARSAISELVSSSTSFFSINISASRVDMSVWRASSSTEVTMFAAK